MEFESRIKRWGHVPGERGLRIRMEHCPDRPAPEQPGTAIQNPRQVPFSQYKNVSAKLPPASVKLDPKPGYVPPYNRLEWQLIKQQEKLARLQKQLDAEKLLVAQPKEEEEPMEPMVEDDDDGDGDGYVGIDDDAPTYPRRQNGIAHPERQQEAPVEIVVPKAVRRRKPKPMLSVSPASPPPVFVAHTGSRKPHGGSKKPPAAAAAVAAAATPRTYDSSFPVPDAPDETERYFDDKKGDALKRSATNLSMRDEALPTVDADQDGVMDFSKIIREQHL